uniref:Uncharacterized protein n=1 Tax=Rhizophora mucronata TaxID=61149 RepID=A0A2P2INT3_RHIMU
MTGHETAAVRTRRLTIFSDALFSPTHVLNA